MRLIALGSSVGCFKGEKGSPLLFSLKRRETLKSISVTLGIVLGEPGLSFVETIKLLGLTSLWQTETSSE
jgi:hypothetical protein